jgi:hypothetical protein
LEHRTSVKRLVYFSFLILTQSAGLLGQGINPSQGRYLHKQNESRHIHASTRGGVIQFSLCPVITPRHGPPGKHRPLLSRMRVYWSVT